jgi:hypothetical protein
VLEIDRRDFLKGAIAAGVTASVSGTLLSAEAFAKDPSGKTRKETAMKSLKFFMDTHDRVNKTFPAKITPIEFEGFYAKGPRKNKFAF